MKPVEKSETMSPSTETTRLQGAESSKAVEKETAQGNGQGELAFGEETPEQREAREKQERVDKAASLRSRHAQLSEEIKQKQLEYRFMNDRKKQYQARKELEKFYDEIEDVEQQLKETGEPMQVKRFERPAKKERTQHAARKAYDEMKKKYANDDEVMEILNNTDPQDIYEEIGIALGSSKLLFKSKGEGASRKRGVAEETGWKWNDVKGMFPIFDNEKGQSVQNWAETFWADLDEGAKNKYSSVDIANMMIDVLSGVSTIGDLRNIVLGNRVRQAEELLEHREKEEEYWRDMERHEQEMRDTEEEAMLEHIKDLAENLDMNEINGILADKYAKEEKLKENGDERKRSDSNSSQSERSGVGDGERKSETGRNDNTNDREDKNYSSVERPAGEIRADSQEDARASRGLDSQRVSQERAGLSAKEREIVNRVNAGINEAIDDLDAEIRDLEKKGDDDAAEAALLERDMLENSREDMIDNALAEYDELQGIKRGTRAEKQAAERREKSIADRKAKRMRDLLEKLRDPDTSDVKRRAVVRQLADLGVDASGYLDSASQNGLEVRDEGLENEETRKRADEEQGNEDGLSTRYQKTDGTTQELSAAEKALRDGLVEKMRSAGIEVVTDSEEGQRVLDEVNGRVKEAKHHVSLQEAESFVEESLQGKRQGQTIEIMLPESTQRKVKQVMGRDFDSHSITANSIVHSKKNHGAGGRKNTESSIPLRDEDFKLAPYIMVSPDRVEKGSWDAIGRESIRFIKNLSNGYVIVVEKEQKNSPDDMETITMWAEKSSRVADARSGASPAIDVQNVITSFDAAKIRKDGETASKDGEKISEHRVWHGSGADFDAFDHSHMGEGEGAQAYGWGTYVTEVEGIARSYAPDRRAYKGKVVTPDPYSDNAADRAEFYIQQERGVDNAIKFCLEEMKANVAEGETEIANDYKDVIEVLRDKDNWRKPQRMLYEVEIPDNDGTNYLRFDKPLSDEQLERIASRLGDEDAADFRASYQPVADAPNADEVNAWSRRGENILKQLSWLFGHDGRINSRAASEFLRDCGFTGIVYPAEYRSGGRRDGAKNYVIFNEKDLKIVNKTRLFRTEAGDVYGFVKEGKIYLDPKLASSETVVHEYSHLWSEALRKSNPKAWEQLKSELLKDKETMDVVKKLYPELEGDELMDEVFAHFSGKRGAERLRAEQERLMNEAKDESAKSRIAKVFDRIKGVLDRYWNMARNLMAGKTEGIEKLSAEDFADMAMNDLLRGEKPEADSRGMTRYEKMARGYETSSRNTGTRDEQSSSRAVEQSRGDLRYRLKDERKPTFYSNAELAGLGGDGIATNGTGLVMHAVDVTDAMRKSVLEGQPLFRK